jgi:hypothetical protein
MRQHCVRTGGSFTLTSGIFADQPAAGVTSGGVVSGALHSFVLSAALELKGRHRVNVVSPTMVEDSTEEFGHLFPDLQAVSMSLMLVPTTSQTSGQQCDRDIVVRSNVIVDVRACSPTVGSAGMSIAQEIAEKVGRTP